MAFVWTNQFGSIFAPVTSEGGTNAITGTLRPWKCLDFPLKENINARGSVVLGTTSVISGVYKMKNDLCEGQSLTSEQPIVLKCYLT